MQHKLIKIFLDANGKEVPLPENEKILWRVSGYALVENQGRILVVVPTWNDQFEFPGGGVDEQEHIKDGIIRECYEETGYQITIHDAIPFYVSEENFYHRHFRKFYHSFIIVYRARLKNRKQNLKVINVSDGDEISQIHWKDLSVFSRRNTHRVIYPAIQRLRRLGRSQLSTFSIKCFDKKSTASD